MRVLSGIQPTGRFHWGNYFGAIRQYIDLQHADEAYYFVANLHALTTVRDAAQLQQLTLDAAIDLLALGLDPQHAILFCQSDVPEVSELCWLLMTGTPMGLLERCHAYKDKKAKGLPADAGLFTYPVLMAADILIYDADTVPVGEDQVQHIEVCRDIAGSFNHLFGETFVLPKAKLLETSARVPGTDGEKMSKSYNNTLELFEEPGVLRKKIMRITTDSRPVEQPKEPDGDHLYQLYSLFATDAERESMAALYRRGGFGYGEVKKALADLAERFFAEPRARRAELVAHPERVREILADGANRARKKAAAVLNRAKRPAAPRSSQKHWRLHAPPQGHALRRTYSPAQRLGTAAAVGYDAGMTSKAPQGQHGKSRPNGPAPFDVGRFVLWLACGLVSAVLLTALAVLIEGHFAPLLLFPALLGLALGGALVLAMRVLQIAHRTAIVTGALVVAAALVAFHHYASYMQAKAHDREISTEVANARRLFTELADRLAPGEATNIFDFLKRSAERGTQILGRDVRGPGMWTLWAIDAVLVSALPVILVVLALRQPYCASCRSWYQVVRAVDVEGQQFIAVSRVLNTELRNGAGARIRIWSCKAGCGPIGCELLWKVRGSRPPIFAWLDAVRRDGLTTILDDSSPARVDPGSTA